MSMKINGNYNHSTTKYVEEAMRKKEAADGAKQAKEAQKAEEAGGAGKAAGKTDGAKAAQPHDEYISSEKDGAKPTGLYRVGQDEDGRRRILYDDPKKSGSGDEKKQPKVNGKAPEKPEEECMANTDKVDREIRKLKEKKSQIERQIRSASGDEKKTEELEKKLAQVENELKQKDNDTYRRQHSSYSRLESRS